MSVPLTRPGLFSISDATNPLPVSLVSFTGRRAASAVRLTWQTGLELNNAGFTIERQLTGTSEWQPAAFVPGTGTSKPTTTSTSSPQQPSSIIACTSRT